MPFPESGRFCVYTVPEDIDHTPVLKFSIKGSQIPQFLELKILLFPPDEPDLTKYANEM